jgi:hypothetical protein
MANDDRRDAQGNVFRKGPGGQWYQSTMTGGIPERDTTVGGFLKQPMHYRGIPAMPESKYGIETQSVDGTPLYPPVRKFWPPHSRSQKNNGPRHGGMRKEVDRPSTTSKLNQPPHQHVTPGAPVSPVTGQARRRSKSISNFTASNGGAKAILCGGAVAVVGLYFAAPAYRGYGYTNTYFAALSAVVTCVGLILSSSGRTRTFLKVLLLVVALVPSSFGVIAVINWGSSGESFATRSILLGLGFLISMLGGIRELVRLVRGK